ncbi:EthD domain-containing protein [Flavisphingomonas formosensis]|uniref:EthD domain-containing protein n=1 Tax=Flavisphingomonas formosensis TaxID=861534 RepID=UPI0012FAF239|nr:EthD domain-containing protein [Sphingomonas formosensis]
MAKLIFFLKRKQGITPEQFREHYENSHARFAQKYVGHLLTGYHRNYPTFAALDPSNVPEGSSPTPYDIGYDAITEMRVKDMAAVEEIGRIFNDPAIQPILKEDERKFLDDSATVMIVCDEVDTGVAFTKEPEPALP